MSNLPSLSPLSLDKAETSTMALVWHGTFSFDGVYFATTPSKDLRIRRATHESLCDISDPNGTFDHDLDWYQAQLMHHGLPLSNNHATAKMRLLEAFQDGTLTVPKGILKLEHNLEKEWNRRYLQTSGAFIERKTKAVVASVAQRKLRDKLGSPFHFKFQNDVAAVSENRGLKRKGDVFTDPPEQKRNKSQHATANPAQRVAHANYGVTLSTRFKEHNASTEQQSGVASTGDSKTGLPAGQIIVRSRSQAQTGNKASLDARAADPGTNQVDGSTDYSDFPTPPCPQVELAQAPAQSSLTQRNGTVRIYDGKCVLHPLDSDSQYGSDANTDRDETLPVTFTLGDGKWCGIWMNEIGFQGFLRASGGIVSFSPYMCRAIHHVHAILGTAYFHLIQDDRIQLYIDFVDWGTLTIDVNLTGVGADAFAPEFLKMLEAGWNLSEPGMTPRASPSNNAQ
ncbi:hypothetical protein N7452_001122 [Penicillium brevicompactum]|uniref:Uncharacterized protein n=1 Tax=Penicillium brevicompactum TaxID=5074 RepID=A0A9W9UNY2_PENBR|nr:hypothetical protein N7452_001122 [Penicillium brevicompactum]